MKKIIVLAIALFIFILGGCSNGEAQKDTLSDDKNNTYAVSDFCNDVCGIWVLLEEDNPYSSVSFLSITNDLQMTGGVYPGSSGRTCNICEIKQNADNSFNAVLQYPATEATDMDDAMPEKSVEAIFDSNDMFRSSLFIEYEDGVKQEFEFVSLDFEEATAKFDQIIADKDKSSVEETDAERQDSEDVGFILNREIFIFKNDFPEVYYAGINDIESMNAYSDDWTMSNVLNDTNFRNIRWTSEDAAEGVRVVTFSGDSINMQYSATVSVDFYVQDGAATPLAISLKIVTDNDTSYVTVQNCLEAGMDSDQALISTDATICMMIVFFADDAID